MNRLVSHFFEKVPADELYNPRIYSKGEKIWRVFYKILMIAVPLNFILLAVSLVVAVMM